MPELTCPFLGSECITTGCNVWDTVNTRCGLKTSDIQITIRDLHIHIHDQHKHELQHAVEDLSAGGGKDFNANYNSNSMAVATVLMQEMVNNQDLDNNGAVYWTDFIISNDDADKPQMLKSVESGQPGSPPAVEVGWAEFLIDNTI